MKLPLLAAALSVILAAPGATPRDKDPDTRTRDYLASAFHLDGDDFDALASGRAVAHSIDVQDDREVASVGAVLLHVPARFYANELKRVTGFKSHDGVLQLGTFGTPARLADVSALTLDRDDAEDLARCRPGHCDIQLSSGAMERFRETLAGEEGNAQAADEVMRQVLVDLVNEYRQSGDAALMTYT
ncbi:MAG TPA: hypothetical protein VG871_03365, partial [Vicinamibacterales bacterium]|nr:hypothetical protein [Vicinamibacterales bacterium]